MSEVETPPESLETPPPVESPPTQAGWDKQSDDERITRLQEAHNPADLEEPLPPESVEKPEAKADTPSEEPEPPPEETPAEEEVLLAGKYKTPEELEKAYSELQTKLGTQGEELRQSREQRREPEPKPEIKPPDPFNETDVARYAKEVSEAAVQNATKVATDLIQKNEAGRPVRDMIGQFADDHPELSPEVRMSFAVLADGLANAAQKPVSLDEAFEHMTSTLGVPPKTNEQTAPVDKTVAIKEAAKVKKTLSETPASPPPGEVSKGKLTPSQWGALPEEERLRRMREIPLPPEGG